MRGRGGSKILLIAGAVVLTVVLFLAPKKSMKQTGMAEQPRADFDISDLLQYQESALDADERAVVAGWKDSIASGASLYYDSLASLWDEKDMFVLSGYYFEQKASSDKQERSYLSAAYRYFDAYKQAVDSTMRAAMVDAAIRSYKEVLNVNPSNDDAKTDLGILYAEASPRPMEGIKLLQEVVAGNPEHENAQLNLGLLSVRSGQYDKAVSRFTKVLEINPRRHEVWLLLARTYMEMGKDELAIKPLEEFKSVSTDTERIAEVDRLLDKLKNKRTK